MIDVLNLIFSGPYTFFGTIILIAAVFEGISTVLEALKE